MINSLPGESLSSPMYFIPIVVLPMTVLERK